LHRSPLTLLRRLATAGLALSLAGAIVADLGPPRPSVPRPGPGTVQDVPLSFASGSVAGRVGGVEPARLQATAGQRGSWTSALVPLDGARMVGLSWRDTAHGPWTAVDGAGVWVRTRGATGWTGWSPAEPADDGPDPGSAEDQRQRVFSDAVWLPAGTSAMQVRVELPGHHTASVERLTAHLVSPDPSPLVEEQPPRGAAVAATAKPAIISRARWGADERLRGGPPSYADTVKAAFVHHTAQSNRYSRRESAALVRADYLYHVRARGWNDIGYNFLIDRFGQVFEGRAGGVDRPVVGACTAGFNTRSSCVALLGNFSTSRPPAAAMAALRRLLAWKLDLTHVDPAYTTVLTSAGGSTSRFRRGTRVRLRTISGHRDTSFTSCPGARVYSGITPLRVAVAATGGPKIYGGATSAAAVNPGSTRVGLPLRFNRTVRWWVKVVAADGRVMRRWAGISRATRVVWDGRDGRGQAAAAGRATFTATAMAGGRRARPLTASVLVAGSHTTTQE
jgi:hypothetical protein